MVEIINKYVIESSEKEGFDVQGIAEEIMRLGFVSIQFSQSLQLSLAHLSILSQSSLAHIC